MREIYPSHYAAFHCIAGACPDSCCKEWEIVVDTASAERYRSVSGTLGERLRQAMITDADGDIVFQEHNSRCPFWNAQQLCDIHGELGEDALCETCRLFPRITQDYGDFIEYDISPRLSGSGKAAVFDDTEAVATDRTQFSGNNRGTAGIRSGEHAAAARTTTSIIFSVTGRFCFCLCTAVRLSDTCGTMGRCFAGTGGYSLHGRICFVLFAIL